MWPLSFSLRVYRLSISQYSFIIWDLPQPGDPTIRIPPYYSSASSILLENLTNCELSFVSSHLIIDWPCLGLSPLFLKITVCFFYDLPLIYSMVISFLANLKARSIVYISIFSKRDNLWQTLDRITDDAL